MALGRVVPVRHRLGAEELIELGQASVAPAVSPAVAAGPVSAPAGRIVTLSREEASLLVKLVEGMAEFAQSAPIEFLSYCPEDRWKKTLEQAQRWGGAMKYQLRSGAERIDVPMEAVFHIVDLEKCISAARDARVDAAKIAFGLSAAGALGSTLLGISWLGVPMYLAGLAVLFGRPLMAKLSPEPQEPFKPSISGTECIRSSRGMFGLGDHTDKRKVLERVIVCPSVEVERHHWGEVRPSRGPVQAAVCLAKGRFRVRVEGWLNDVVIAHEGWERVPPEECEARIEISVWQPCGLPPRRTIYGPIPQESGHEETYWVEYVGPLTDGACRRAGPFG